MIKITKNEKPEMDLGCDNCDNVTYFSDADDDFQTNYDETYTFIVANSGVEMTLCGDCLKELRSAINEILEE